MVKASQFAALISMSLISPNNRKTDKPYQLFGHTKHSIRKRRPNDENKNHLFRLHIIRRVVELGVELFCRLYEHLLRRFKP